MDRNYWEEHVDPTSGATYYYHTGTNETTWDKPKDAAPMLAGILNFDTTQLRPQETKVTYACDIINRSWEGAAVGDVPGLIPLASAVAEKAKDDATETKNGETMTGATPEEMHGYGFPNKAAVAALGAAAWNAPFIKTHCNAEARPGYASMKADEYVDQPEVLRAKVKMLAKMMRESKACVAYTGAGISTSSGIGDYATQATDSITSSATKKKKLRSPYEAQPTLCHRMLVAAEQNGLLQYWVQQNHDGLPQKAGMPQHKINEIHGAWYDPSNPVVAMSGELRTDLFHDMLAWEKKADLCLAFGTSMCGMNSDRVAISTGNRHRLEGNGIGTVICSIQRTQYDHLARLRIFATLDTLAEMLAEELAISPVGEDFRYAPQVPAERVVGEHQFLIKYDQNDGTLVGTSDKSSNSSENFHTGVLDLREDQKVKLVSGPHAGDEGVVLGTNLEGHYRIRFFHALNKKRPKKKVPFVRVMGAWWVEAACLGTTPSIPIVNI